jgi:molybdopterin-guanine dinucleotide biosynthesis protein A
MIAGVILAGGQGRRMGGADKALMPLFGRPLIAHAIERITPQVNRLAISANGDPARFQAFGLPVLPDPLPDFPGPLAGILAGLRWAAQAVPGARWLLSIPCDAPFLPHDLAKRLMQAAATEETRMALAVSRGRTHPVIALWPLEIADDLERALGQEGLRKAGAFVGHYSSAHVVFSDVDGQDPFLNLNSQEDLKSASTSR